MFSKQKYKKIKDWIIAFKIEIKELVFKSTNCDPQFFIFSVSDT